jgi:hypothetical protein
LTVLKGTSITLALKCNLASAPTAGSFTVNAYPTPTTDYSITGLTSGNTVTPTFGTGDGGAQTVATGSFAVSVDSSTFASTTVAGGITGVNMGIIKFRASNEDVNLTKVGLKLTLGTAFHIGTVYLYNSSGVQVGTVIFPQGSTITATSTLTTPVLLTKNTDVLLTIKVDTAAIGVGQSGNPGQPVVINPISAEGSGLSSGTTLVVGNVTPGIAGVRTFKSFPTISSDVLGSTGLADGHLMRFKISADSHGDISIYELSFSMATSGFATGGGVSNVKLYAYTDSGYQSLVQTTIGSATGQFGATNSVFAGGSPSTMTFRATTNALPVPAGTTRYFDLVGTVSSLGTSGTSVTTTLLGDDAYTVRANLNSTTEFVSSTTGVIANSATSNRFIWSGNSTSTPTIANDTDWANGFSIVGLPAGGFSLTRNQ